MANGDHSALCFHCGGFFPANQHHVCYGRMKQTYAPNPADAPLGAVPVPVLTEDRVRQIIREELGRFRQANSVNGEPQ